MQATLDQLTHLSLFSPLGPKELGCLQPYTHLQRYHRKEIIFHEGDLLPVKLHILLSGTLLVKKNTPKAKETILRSLRAGDLFAAAALFGGSHSPATVLAIEDCQVLTIPKAAILDAISEQPELAIQFFRVLNQRLQQLHNTVHSLISERAIVRLARLIYDTLLQQGAESTVAGERLRIKLPYYQIARRIGITYEECARLMKKLAAIIKYSRGGKIIILDQEILKAIVSGEAEPDC